MSENTVTIVIPDHTEADGMDRIYIHGADIVDPTNNVNVTWDDSVEPVEPIYLVTIEPAEDDAPYRAAIEELGISITGTDAEGNWVGRQLRPLA